LEANEYTMETPMQARPLGMAIAALLLAGTIQARAQDPIEDVLAATFRIVDGQASATCFLVMPGSGAGPDAPTLVLVTAAHFFEGTSGPECQLVLRSSAADGSWTRREIPIAIRNAETPRWTRHPDMDLAALAVDLPADAGVKPLRFESLASAEEVVEGRVRVGQEVIVPCFPAKLEANAGGWPVLRQGMIATHPLVPVQSAKTFLVDVSTFGGDSGAPVIVRTGPEPLVVGLVLGMQRQTDRASLPFEEKTVHMPLGLAIVAQSVFVRETVAAVRK
jgi:hypothetical protein